ncbi:Fur family transcriptional regulator [Hydrogenophaga laconesensis]|uniref:Fur family ferric uptake transcriptional regulator n=1 Tax=Hydrogenophaga laconesensis TaxID=1805971 RepID=A0ABU1V8L7_9BURK|nr:Fur family transcriptional regulator [Hydrogenophaga laconesensis]MDR7093804.1 Fur family ferric uptake transcriptional regulator [Hydrogenophaga laconesensis]
MPSTTRRDTVVAVPPHVQTRLEAAGLRRTLATRAVIGLFLAQPAGGLTHAQALHALNNRGLDINRVTLYRLLDRLAVCGVLQRHTDDQARTWRFSLAPAAPEPGEEGAVPRFECDACHRAFALPEASAPTRAMAQSLLDTLARLGHHGERVDVSVHGTCAGCVEGVL